MSTEDWLADTRISYDTVAVSYSDVVRSAVAEQPYMRAALALFADTVRAAGGGPVADVGCGPRAHHRPPARPRDRCPRHRPVPPE